MAVGRAWAVRFAQIFTWMGNLSAWVCRLLSMVLLWPPQSNSKPLQKLRPCVKTLSSSWQRTQNSIVSYRCSVIGCHQTFLCDAKPQVSLSPVWERKQLCVIEKTVLETRTQRHACCQSLVEIFVLEIFLNISSRLNFPVLEVFSLCKILCQIVYKEP